ncbi:glycosyltransferase [uncultured Vibrio sp.]|uniref:glycosyltransferase n=1 Tax=uncultured Vibrio sp. TaxID=114054 RepID=UPI0025D35B5C|nr:glycosyltransferase [uncultured Vibrio sp.]
MIFATVGSQMPFDRMMKVIDEWAKETQRSDIVAQVGNTQAQFQNLGCHVGFTPSEYQRQIEKAEVVIGHAGMGTILTCLELGKPLLIMAREGVRRETRNDHQIATKNWVKDWQHVLEFDSAETLEQAYQAALQMDTLPTSNQYSESDLIDFLNGVINS